MHFARVRGGGFGGGGCLVLVGLMLLVFLFGMCRGAMRVLGWVGLGMFVWGVLWVGMHSSGVVVVVLMWCGVLIRLESRVTL